MPLYEYRCSQGHRKDHYFHRAEQALLVWECEECIRPALRQFPRTNTPQFFSESSPRIIQNLDPSTPITSPAQHAALMKREGVEYASQWHTSKYKMTNGLPTKASPPRPRID